LTRDGDWYGPGLGVSVQSHVSEGDTLGVAAVVDGAADAVLSDAVLVGAPYTAQNGGFEGINASNYATVRIPDSRALTVVIRFTYGLTWFFAPTVAANGGIAFGAAPGGAMRAGGYASGGSLAVEIVSSGNVKIGTYQYAVLRLDRDTLDNELRIFRQGSSASSHSVVWSSGLDVGGLGSSDHYIGAGPGMALPYSGAVPLMVYIYGRWVSTADVTAYFSNVEVPDSSAIGAPIAVQGVRLGVEMDAAPAALYPLATGAGAAVTAEARVVA
jgi:hypothetical protein